MMEKNKETKRKFGDIFSESDEASSKKFKDSPRSSLPASPAAKYWFFFINQVFLIS